MVYLSDTFSVYSMNIYLNDNPSWYSTILDVILFMVNGTTMWNYKKPVNKECCYLTLQEIRFSNRYISCNDLYNCINQLAMEGK